MNNSKCLYYPFSRCMNSDSLKQMLLIFDEINFLDPVVDEDWRQHLFDNLVVYAHNDFVKYKDTASIYSELIDEKIIKIIRPCDIKDLKETIITKSSLSDLEDKQWIKNVCPQKFNLPFQTFKNEPIWQIFKDKLPESFISKLESNKKYSPHLLEKGSDIESWGLTYAAGSSICTNYHLAVADKYGLSPITDSPLHNYLLTIKRKRIKPTETSDYANTKFDNIIRASFSTKFALDMIRNLDSQTLLKADVDSIMKFRNNFSKYREQAESCLTEKFLAYYNTGGDDKELKRQLLLDISNFNGELINTTNKTTDNIKIFLQNIGTFLGVISAIVDSNPYYILMGSILGIGAGLVEINDKEKSINNKRPEIYYLSMIKKHFQ